MARTEIPIERLAAVVGARVDQVVRAVKIELFTGVIMDTRVDTGRLRGSWITTTGSPGNSPDRPDPSGIAASAEVVANVTADRVDYLSSNLPYSAVWEERDGMISRNAARVVRVIEEQVRKGRT